MIWYGIVQYNNASFSSQNLVPLLIKDNAEQQVPYTFKRCLEADVVRHIQQNFRADKTLPWKVCCCNTTGNLLAGRCVDPEFWKMLENSTAEQFKCFIDVSFCHACYTLGMLGLGFVSLENV